MSTNPHHKALIQATDYAFTSGRAKPEECYCFVANNGTTEYIHANNPKTTSGGEAPTICHGFSENCGTTAWTQPPPPPPCAYRGRIRTRKILLCHCICNHHKSSYSQELPINHGYHQSYHNRIAGDCRRQENELSPTHTNIWHSLRDLMSVGRTLEYPGRYIWPYIHAHPIHQGRQLIFT